MAFLFLAVVVVMYFLMPRVPEITLPVIFVNGTTDGIVSTAELWADVELFNTNYADLVSVTSLH